MNETDELKQLLADKEMTIGVLDAAIKAKDEVHKEDMAAKDEQLAEMREALEAQLEELGELYNYLDGFPTSIDDLLGKEFMLLSERATALTNKALSAAPKRGRMIWQEEMMGETKGVGDNELTTFEGTTGSLYVTEWFLTDEQISEWFRVTVREVPPIGPIDCPKCGTAGGDELGPCSMCKGAGFVDGDDIPDGLKG